MKEDIEKLVRESRIIAIIRGFKPDICLKLADAYARGGIRMVEVSSTKRPPRRGRILSQRFG